MTEEIAARVQHHLDNISSAHPLMPLVSENGSIHARKHVFQYFLGRLVHDDEKDRYLCPYCHEDGPTNINYEKNWGYNLTQHIWTCENERFKEDYCRCNFCGLFVPQKNVDEANEHFNNCYVETLVEMYVKLAQGKTMCAYSPSSFSLKLMICQRCAHACAHRLSTKWIPNQSHLLSTVPLRSYCLLGTEDAVSVFS